MFCQFSSFSITSYGSGHRLFHVFMEDGLYHALPATGALGAMQLKASETWNPKVQRIGIKERGGGVGLQPSCCCFQKIAEGIVDNVLLK